jgi:hypothetical protein
MKTILLLSVIASIIPAFFTFVFVHGTKNRLASLRERCSVAPDSAKALADYDAARAAFPSSVVARLFGFTAVEANPSTPPKPSSPTAG